MNLQEIRQDQLPPKRRNRGGVSKASRLFIDEIKIVLRDLSRYWPLTLRQVYYQLVSLGKIENHKKEYGSLSLGHDCSNFC